MSVTARLNRLKDVASDVTRTTVRVATPVVSATAAKVRARLQREPQPVRAPAPTRASTPEPATEPAPVPTSRRAGPNPGSVARNIAPHPPQANPAPARPTSPSAPGAKLPPRRRPAAEGQG